MVDQQWRRVRELFESAIELPPGERGHFLRAQCDADFALRARVEALLTNDAADDQFMQPPEGASPSLTSAERMLDAPPCLASAHSLSADTLEVDRWVGQVIGGFTIERVIAVGGMGTVYFAQQENPRRPVALKVMHGGLWSAAARRRFEFESQVLAQLSHPSIAHVYQAGVHVLAGTAGARGSAPYFAMEYIAGARTLTTFAAEQRLGVKERLGLFVQVCEAVQHGHQKGVIHRDLKPANILVNDHGVAKVIDFGVARAVDADIAITTMQTEVGQIIGTLAYMSPEQISGDSRGIDTTSDVYALGVVLFELLAGRLPFDDSRLTLQSAASIICNQEPARPSDLHRGLRGDIDTIILKALQKDRMKRYATAEALADDIRRHLRSEPISARPPSRWLRVTRWATRHPIGTTSLACLTVAALIAVGTFTAFEMAAQRPFRVSWDANAAHLHSLAGPILHTWSGGDESIRFAQLVNQPAKLGRRRLGIIGFGQSSTIHRGLVCAFDIDSDWLSPLWWKSVEREQWPKSIVKRGPAAWDFDPCQRACHVADIFPGDESPGDEIAVVFGHHFSMRALVIYDSSGELLYQVWQDGGISRLYWMPEAGLLICSGLDERAKDALSLTPDATTASVLFALRPQRGFISRDLVSCDAPPGPLNPIWYRYLSRANTALVIASLELTRPGRNAAQGRAARIGVNMVDGFQNYLGGLALTVDDAGRELPNTRELNDAHIKNQPKLPPPDEIQFSDDPPTKPWSTHGNVAAGAGESDGDRPRS